MKVLRPIVAVLAMLGLAVVVVAIGAGAMKFLETSPAAAATPSATPAPKLEYALTFAGPMERSELGMTCLTDCSPFWVVAGTITAHDHVKLTTADVWISGARDAGWCIDLNATTHAIALYQGISLPWTFGPDDSEPFAFAFPNRFLGEGDPVFTIDADNPRCQ